MSNAHLPSAMVTEKLVSNTEKLVSNHCELHHDFFHGKENGLSDGCMALKLVLDQNE